MEDLRRSIRALRVMVLLYEDGRDRPVGPQASTGTCQAEDRAHSSTASAGIGLAMKKPCAMSHPTSRRNASERSSSTPSATIDRPRLWPRPTVDRTISPSDELPANPSTKERSILSSFPGSGGSYASDEYPVPKSSTESPTPTPASSCNVASARSG